MDNLKEAHLWGAILGSSATILLAGLLLIAFRAGYDAGTLNGSRECLESTILERAK